MQKVIKGTFLLEKMPMKGGWTFTRIPKISTNKGQYFGFIKVSGNIDGYPISHYNLMPIKNSDLLFLPIKAEIRKKIKKQAGDTIDVEIWEETNPKDIPQEILDCLEEAPNAKLNFEKLSENEKTLKINWIYSAKTEETKAERIAEWLENLEKV